MRYSSLLWACLVPAVLAVTSSAPVTVTSSVSPSDSSDHDIEVGVYEHNDTHSVVRMKSQLLGLDSELLVAHDNPDFMSMKPSDALHNESIPTDGPASSDTGDSGDTHSPEAAGNEEGDASDSAPSAAQSHASSAAPKDVQLTTDGSPMVPEGLQVSTTTATKIQHQGASSSTVGSGENGAHIISPQPSALEDSPTSAEMDSSVVLPSPAAETADSLPLSAVDSPAAASSPAIPAMGSSNPGLSSIAVDADETRAADDDDDSEEPNVDPKTPGLRSDTQTANEQHIDDAPTDEEDAEDAQTEDEDEDVQTEKEDAQTEEEEDSSSSEEDDTREVDGDWTRSQIVTGTVRGDGGPSVRGATDPQDSPGRVGERNATTFALVMCGTVGATFVVLVGVWINRMRHNERLRRLQEDEDEEFTVFSASDTPVPGTPTCTGARGGRYTPLR